MPWTDGAKWYDGRLAHNRKPAHYTCPLCGQQLPSMSEHMLLFPDGDHDRRRHAHTACVMQARAQGKLPTRDEWIKQERAKARETRRAEAGDGGAQPRDGAGDERRLSARRILWALRPKPKRSRPSDS